MVLLPVAFLLTIKISTPPYTKAATDANSAKSNPAFIWLLVFFI
ncbi:MAG: hypothetical protein ACD_41C00018G0001, partial [uncultured bacterium]